MPRACFSQITCHARSLQGEEPQSLDFAKKFPASQLPADEEAPSLRALVGIANRSIGDMLDGALRIPPAFAPLPSVC